MDVKSNKETSFAAQLAAGALKEELIKKYSLTEKEFEKQVHKRALELQKAVGGLYA